LALKTSHKSKRVEPFKALKFDNNTSDESESDEDLAFITQRLKRIWKKKWTLGKTNGRARIIKRS